MEESSSFVVIIVIVNRDYSESDDRSREEIAGVVRDCSIMRLLDRRDHQKDEREEEIRDGEIVRNCSFAIPRRFLKLRVIINCIT